MRSLLMLFAVFALATVQVSATSEQTYSLTELLRMNGKVVAANEDYVWVLVESYRGDNVELYICSYDKENPDAGSQCQQIT